MNTPTTVQGPADLAVLRDRIARSPFFNWFGIEIVSSSGSEVEFRLPWQDGFLATPELGGVAGGVLATAIDVGSSYAVLAATGRIFVTTDLRVDYHGLAEKGDLKVTGKVLRAGRTIATCDASVFDLRGKLVASGRATMFNRNLPLDGSKGKNG